MQHRELDWKTETEKKQKYSWEQQVNEAMNIFKFDIFVLDINHDVICVLFAVVCLNFVYGRSMMHYRVFWFHCFDMNLRCHFLYVRIVPENSTLMSAQPSPTVASWCS